MNPNAPIGLYDSGVGGLSVVSEVFRQLPGESVLYLGDTARVPYGSRRPEEIWAFNEEILDRLVRMGAKAILIACNTSSAIVLPAIRARYPVPVLGLIEAGAEAACARGRDIGMIATETTVRSGAHARALSRLAPDARLRAVGAPALVPLVESGCWEGPEAEAVLTETLAPFRAEPPEALILGCTHYPHLAPVIQRLLGPSVALIDPAARAVSQLADILPLSLRACARPCHRFLVTGNPEPFYRLASQLFPGCIEQVEQVRLAEHDSGLALGVQSL